MTSEEVEALARELFHKASADGIWAATDEIVRLHFRKIAARKLQQTATRERV